MTECKNDVMMQFLTMPQWTIYNIIFYYTTKFIHSSAATAIIEIIIIIDLLSLQQKTTTKWKKRLLDTPPWNSMRNYELLLDVVLE